MQIVLKTGVRLVILCARTVLLRSDLWTCTEILVRKKKYYTGFNSFLEFLMHFMFEYCISKK